MEMFLFKSRGPAGAITLDPDGAALPPTQGGWEKLGSAGNLADMLGQADLDRLRKEGFLILDQDQPRSKRAEDWQMVPRGSFQLTRPALEQARLVLEKVNGQKGDENVLAFLFSPMSMKKVDETEWRNLGTQLTLGAYPASDIPPAAVEYVDGIPLLFLFDPKTLPSPLPTKIDFGPKGFVFAD